MNTVVVNVKVDPKVKKQAQKVAAELGFSLSALIKGYLKDLIKTKSITFSAASEEPSEYMLRALRESEEDIKAGRAISFKSGKEALNYLDKMITDEEKSSKN